MTRLLSLGLDGANWESIEGLPNLAALVEDGATADLRSVTPPVTCPAWRCSTSGKNPGKLGVFWWLDFDRDDGELTTPDARSFDTADVWDYLSDGGHRCGIVNVPMTFPPPPIDGTVVSGFGAPFDLEISEPITYPPEFQERLDEYDWRVTVDDVTTSDGLERTYDLIRSRFELLMEFIERDEFDYLHLTVFYINVLQHKYGDGPETRRGWEIIDEYVGELDDDLTKIVYSDHGHSTIQNTFVVNRFLQDRGYLVLDDDADWTFTETVLGRTYTTLRTLGISPRRIARLASDFLPDAVDVSPGYPVPTADVDGRIDWSASTAVAVSQGPVYLNRDRLGDDYESTRESLAAELRSITHDGAPVLRSVEFAEDVYHGDHVEEAPDLLLVPADGWELYGGLTPETFERAVSSWTSGNDPLGMLVLHGDDVRSSDLGERSILDVMPTVLRYMGCPVPTDVDGTAITEPFDTPIKELGYRDPLPSSRRYDGEDDEIRSMLKEIGYLE